MVKFMRPIAAGLVAIVLAAGIACSSNAAPVATTANSAAATVAGGPAVQANTRPSTNSQDLSTADLVKLAEPSIVRIATGGGVGTGFVVGDDGYIMTNNHVVQPSPTGRGSTSSAIKVTLSDGSVVDAKIIGVDARADLALIKIEQTGLKALKIGSLDSTVVGQDVVAIGFALDLKMGEGPSFSVTRGIISAKNRAITEGAAILGAIQTDAAINHGNSGGPLLNLTGEVVGVNTAIAPDNTTGGIAPGIGFAVGADTVKAVYDEIRASGKVNRGLLGIQNFDSLRPAKARDLGLSTDLRGVLLNETSVVAGQPASAGGLKANDVITRISDFVIRSEGDLAVALIKNHAGDRVTVEFYRDGKKSSTQVTLGTPTT